VATSREGHRSPRSGRAGQHPRWDRGLPGIPASRRLSLDTLLDAAMIFPVNKIPISTVIEGRGRSRDGSVGAASKNRFDTLITGGNRRWTVARSRVTFFIGRCRSTRTLTCGTTLPVTSAALTDALSV